MAGGDFLGGGALERKSSLVFMIGTGYVVSCDVKRLPTTRIPKTYKLCGGRRPVWPCWIRVVDVQLAVALLDAQPHPYVVPVAYLMSATEEVVLPLSEGLLLQPFRGHNNLVER